MIIIATYNNFYLSWNTFYPSENFGLGFVIDF